MVFLWLHSTGGIWVFSGLAPLSSVTLSRMLQRGFTSPREKQGGVCFAQTSVSRGEAKKGSHVSPFCSRTPEEATGEGGACTSGTAALSSGSRERLKPGELTTLVRNQRPLSCSPPLTRLSPHHYGPFANSSALCKESRGR